MALQDLKKREPERVRGLGKSVMEELEAFYEEGKMNRLNDLEADPKLRCLELFQTISWVGPKKAEELCKAGMRTLEDVRTKGMHLLTEQARLCLNRWGAFARVCGVQQYHAYVFFFACFFFLLVVVEIRSAV